MNIYQPTQRAANFHPGLIMGDVQKMFGEFQELFQSYTQGSPEKNGHIWAIEPRLNVLSSGVF